MFNYLYNQEISNINFYFVYCIIILVCQKTISIFFIDKKYIFTRNVTLLTKIVTIDIDDNA